MSMLPDAWKIIGYFDVFSEQDLNVDYALDYETSKPIRDKEKKILQVLLELPFLYISQEFHVFTRNVPWSSCLADS